MTPEEVGNFPCIAHTIELALGELCNDYIDAVLLDINLLDGDGTKLARLIRKNHLWVPIPLVSKQCRH